MGPVLTIELIRTSRREWHHYLLWLYAGCLLLEFGVLFLMHLAAHVFRVNVSLPAVMVAGFSRELTELRIMQQFQGLLLVVPAFAAGSISDEKTRGTLQEWLTTDLTAWEIIGGKWAAQLVQVGAIALVALPLL